MSIEAPERIWITREDVGQSWPGAFKVFRASDLEHPDCPEYVRADKLGELAAAAAEWEERFWKRDAQADRLMQERDKAEAALAEKDKEIAALREPFESCPDCAGSGYSNHPDSGQVCYRCDGQGSYAHPGILRELITDLLSHLNPSDPETLPLIRRAMEALR